MSSAAGDVSIVWKSSFENATERIQNVLPHIENEYSTFLPINGLRWKDASAEE